jgi:hypothetical protein
MSAWSLPITPAIHVPRARIVAPVSVAMSTIASGRSAAAMTSASAMTRRPSASVFMTSTVVPPWIVITSPSLSAVPEGMLSVQAR